MIYQFKGRCLFWLAGLICLFSIVLAPVGILFIYMAMTAYIRIENDMFVYKMFLAKRIFFRDIRKIYLSRPVEARYKVGYAFVNFATVIPLTIEYVDNGFMDGSLDENAGGRGDGRGGGHGAGRGGGRGVLKKLKLSLNYFEKTQEIAEILEKKTGLSISAV